MFIVYGCAFKKMALVKETLVKKPDYSVLAIKRNCNNTYKCILVYHMFVSTVVSNTFKENRSIFYR